MFLKIFLIASYVIFINVKASPADKQCAENEEYVECPIAQCNYKKCSDIGQSIGCPSIASPCPGGCVCRHGYLWNDSGVCVPQSQCPNPCKQNEVFTECMPKCEHPVTCDELENPRTCTPDILKTWDCLIGCACADGYLRDYNGDCIKKEDCKVIKCTSNETLASCGAECPNAYCPADDEPQPVCDQPYPCDAGCVCKFNYRRNEDGQCNLASECPPVECTRPNEIFNSCPSACLAENCSNKDDPPSTCNSVFPNCDPRCVCKDGHFRSDENICVPRDHC